MDTGRAMLVELAARYSFGDVAALADASSRARVAELCAFGQRLLDLDAEDFGTPDEATSVPDDLQKRARACRMPQSPKEQPRGALESLRPPYRLLLEIIAARWRRREMSALIATVHITSEYLPLLAWEDTLGHAGDPARWPKELTATGSRFGVIGDRSCAHTRSEQSATERTLRVAAGPAPGWRAYLDRQHSNVAHALAICVAECRRTCAAIDWIDDLDTLRQRCRVALDFADSALVRLRHAAPVGHGFGVPSPEEVLEAWARTRSAIDKHPLGRAALVDDGFPLPGLPALFSALSGANLAPDTLIKDTAGRLAALLTP